MASILVTGCEEDGADQSANVASGLTSPCPPPYTCRYLGACVHIRGKMVKKSRLTCLARVGGHPRVPLRTTQRVHRRNATPSERDIGAMRRNVCDPRSTYLRYVLQLAHSPPTKTSTLLCTRLCTDAIMRLLANTHDIFGSKIRKFLTTR